MFSKVIFRELSVPEAWTFIPSLVKLVMKKYLEARWDIFNEGFPRYVITSNVDNKVLAVYYCYNYFSENNGRSQWKQ